tara:strand:- start:74 stop:628 length:555 start_codon:yes stop_codon:yes gene_type:complete
MAVGVSMQSNVPDYANFGQQVSANINAAKERTLRDTLNQRAMAIENQKLDFIRKDRELQEGLRRQQADIEYQRTKAAFDAEDIGESYREAIGPGGQYRRGFFGRLFGRDDITKKEFMELEGIDAPLSQRDIFRQYVGPEYFYPGLGRDLRTPYPEYGTLYGSDAELYQSLYGNNINLMNLVGGR